MDASLQNADTAATASSRNRRIALRKAPRGRFKVECVKGIGGLGRNIAVTVLDLSETGVRLRLSAEAAKGQQVEVSLLGQGHVRPVRLAASVVWCRPTEDNQFEAGIHFEKRLNYRDVQHLT
jgi:hypothetical protein